MRVIRERAWWASVLLALAGAASPAQAIDWLPPFVVGGQATVVWQHLPDFRSPYVGPKSLRPGPEDAVSHSYTLYTGLRLHDGP
jgi:hypothetical protein